MTDDDKALAAFLAERLMGWRLLPPPPMDFRWDLNDAKVQYTGKAWCRGDTYVMHEHDWNPATRWDHAGMVVDAMRERGWLLTLDDLRASWQAIYTADMEDNASEDGAIADTAPRAIAEAARAALEGGS